MQNYGIENNIIIAEPSKNLRTLGRNALSHNWVIAILAVLVYTLIVNVPPDILNAIFGVNIYELTGTDLYSSSMDASLYSALYSSIPKVCALSSIYMLLVTGPMDLGISLFFLSMFRRQIVEVSDIFLGFEKFGKAILLLIYRNVFICLWTLLFIIPGIVAAIRYSQAFFILADDPEKSVRECMNESKTIMKGNKKKFFCLTLSFVGWLVLTAIPVGIISAFSDAMGFDGVMAAVFSIIGGLFAIPVTVYIYSTLAGFYEIAAGHLIKRTEPAPIEKEAESARN